MMMDNVKQYLILTSGANEDYDVSFLEVLSEWPISEDDIVALLNVSFSEYGIEGHIYGKLETSLRMIDLQKESGDLINNLFACWEGKPVSSILDRWYSREECLAIAMQNDASGEAYWQRGIDYRYAQYQKAYALYRKLMGMPEK